MKQRGHCVRPLNLTLITYGDLSRRASSAGDSARAKQAYSDFFTLGKTPTRIFQFCWKPGRNTRRLKFSSQV